MSEPNYSSAHAQHGDRRFDELHRRYGDMAAMTVDELQDRARQQGIHPPSDMDKAELLVALSGGGYPRRGG